MTHPLTLITGASRGLGLAMATQLRHQGHRLLTLSRRPAAELDPPGPGGAPVEQWAVDLADPAPVAARLAEWLAGLDPHEHGPVTFIHNAALMPAPGPTDACALDELSATVRVGLEAPMLLTAAFVQATAGWRQPRRVLNISSGLGRSAMAGAAPYCAIKAGLDHFSRALALDEARRPNGVRVVSIAPGVIDTDMQVQLRSADPGRFVEQARFAGLKSGGQLDTPAQAATKVLAWLDRADFGDTVIADVRKP